MCSAVVSAVRDNPLRPPATPPPPCRTSPRLVIVVAAMSLVEAFLLWVAAKFLHRSHSESRSWEVAVFIDCSSSPSHLAAKKEVDATLHRVKQMHQKQMPVPAKLGLGSSTMQPLVCIKLLRIKNKCRRSKKILSSSKTIHRFQQRTKIQQKKTHQKNTGTPLLQLPPVAGCSSLRQTMLDAALRQCVDLLAHLGAGSS